MRVIDIGNRTYNELTRQDLEHTTYDGFRGAENVSEICAAESGLELTPADFQAFQQLADFMQSIAPQIDQIATNGTVENQGFAGFPVRRVSFRNGKPATTSELVGLRREAIPAPTFAVPDTQRGLRPHPKLDV
jgi:hypothetical protein